MNSTIIATLPWQWNRELNSAIGRPWYDPISNNPMEVYDRMCTRDQKIQSGTKNKMEPFRESRNGFADNRKRNSLWRAGKRSGCSALTKNRASKTTVIYKRSCVCNYWCLDDLLVWHGLYLCVVLFVED